MVLALKPRIVPGYSEVSGPSGQNAESQNEHRSMRKVLRLAKGSWQCLHSKKACIITTLWSLFGFFGNYVTYFWGPGGGSILLRSPNTKESRNKTFNLFSTRTKRKQRLLKVLPLG